MEIKNYVPLALVYYIDGNGNRAALPLPDELRSEFKQAIEQKKMVELEGIVINTYDIKGIVPADKVTDIEKYFYSRSYQERAMISQRIRNRVNNQKVNVIEALEEYGTKNAIELMEGWIAGKEEQTTTVQQKSKQPITDEQKEEIKQRFSDILSKLQAQRGTN